MHCLVHRTIASLSKLTDDVKHLEYLNILTMTCDWFLECCVLFSFKRTENCTGSPWWPPQWADHVTRDCLYVLTSSGCLVSEASSSISSIRDSVSSVMMSRVSRCDGGCHGWCHDIKSDLKHVTCITLSSSVYFHVAPSRCVFLILTPLITFCAEVCIYHSLSSHLFILSFL